MMHWRYVHPSVRHYSLKMPSKLKFVVWNMDSYLLSVMSQSTSHAAEQCMSPTGCYCSIDMIAKITIFAVSTNQMACIISFLPSTNVPSFVKLPIVFIYFLFFIFFCSIHIFQTDWLTEGVAILLSEVMQERIMEIRNINSRICWVARKFGIH